MCKEGGRLHLLLQAGRRVVVDSQAALRIHHSALVLDDLRIECKVLQAIGFQLEHLCERGPW